MKRPLVSLILSLAMSGVVHAEGDAKRAANTVVLDETGVKNLRIETVEVEETDFEATIFSLGRIEAIPRKAASQAIHHQLFLLLHRWRALSPMWMHAWAIPLTPRKRCWRSPTSARSMLSLVCRSIKPGA
jgi:hypothetical protein